MSEFEEAEEATLEGDTPFVAGSVRTALAHRPFTIVWSGALASNVGTWMQNVALGAFGYKLTHSASYVALLGFAQLGPVLVLSLVSGALADAIDRKVLLVVAQTEQMLFSFLLAWVARGSHPSRAAIVWCVLAVGVGNALNGPVFAAVLPILVGKRDLAGAISLQSVQINLSRVIGPAIGGLILPLVGAPGVFSINALTYLFAIGTLLVVEIPRPYPEIGEKGWSRAAAGVRVAKGDPLVRACLLTIFLISLLCLPFIGLMPVIAAQRFHISPTGFSYGIFYACFGLGASLGAISIGTVFVSRARHRLSRLFLAAFGVALITFGLVGVAAWAFPIALIVGFAYFASVTALSTLLQEHLDDNVRGRVMALWIMGFGGTVPLGTLLGGLVAGWSSVEAVVVGGGAVALLLAAVIGLNPDRGP